MGKKSLSSNRNMFPDSVSAIYEEFDKCGWIDGLPIIPPTEELVQDMMTMTPFPPDHIVGRIRPTLRAATVEKIAINAVMAGCKPVHLPAVIAGVEAVTDPAFFLLPIGTNPATPLVMVNGPARSHMDMSWTYRTLGVGHRANLTIGRAVRLVIQNVGQGGALGVLDQTTIGSPVKLGMCMAENEEASPWEPLHVEFGWPGDVSTVTVFNVSGTLNILDEEAKNPSSLLNTIGRSMTAHGMNNFLYPTMPLVILGVEHATILGNAGFTKAQVKQKLWELARIQKDDLSSEIQHYIEHKSKRKNKFINGFIHITDKPDGLAVVVAGGFGPQSMFCPTLGFDPYDAQTRQILFKGEAPVPPPPRRAGGAVHP